eukprot:s916_g24.t1
MEEVHEDEASLLPLHAEFGRAGFQPYVLDLAGVGLAEEGSPEVIALLVMQRQHGLLLALPDASVPAEFLQGGDSAAPQDLVGPSRRVEVQSAVLDEDALQQAPVPVDGRTLNVLLVDFAEGIKDHLSVLDQKEFLAEVLPFDVMEYSLVPDPGDVVEKVFAWARGGEEESVSERLAFYSAEEVPETPAVEPSRRVPRRRGPGAGTGGGGQPTSKKRPTVASLAESLEALTSALPALTEKVQELSTRTAAIESGQIRPPERLSALRKPLAESAMPGSFASSPTPKALLQTMPPPRSSSAPAKSAHVTFSQGEAEEIMQDLPLEGNDLAKAMLEQSRALTQLVSQIAANSGDPFQDLGSSTSSLSSRGAVSRAKLQAELALQRGTFFTNVVQAMGRRMNPALASDVDMATLRDRGTTPTQYLERFGGFGKCKDIGLIIWQVAMVMNYMMEDNHLAAKDALSLLFVCLEQTAMDNGNMQVGLLLSLQEDPPQTIFSARSLATAALPRPFAPTAHQKWVTTALQFLKEMDTIATRRSEVMGSKQSEKTGANAQGSDSASTAPPKRKPKAKGGGKGAKGAQQTQEEEQTFHTVAGGQSPASTVYPIPAPRLGLFRAQRVPKLGTRQWAKALHIVVMALNYIHNNCAFVPLDLLGRRPNATHLAIYSRLRSLLTVCDRPELFPLPPGRSGFEFIARLFELEQFAGSHEEFSIDMYSSAAERAPAHSTSCGTISKEHQFVSAEQFSPVDPYRSLNASRLKLSGTGGWEMADYLDDVLWLPFLEPDVLFHTAKHLWQGPDFSRELESENLKLAKVWDQRGLLALFTEPHHSSLACRVFNAHKNAEHDRQIGDRRWFNAAERHPLGPSRFLPAGSNVTSLHCPKGWKLVGSAADRKDFYHQSKVSRRRAQTNLLPFKFQVEDFTDTTALNDLYKLLREPVRPEDVGDRYGQKPKPILQGDSIKHVWAGFKSLFQGDHLGVEFALSSHTCLLQQHGLLGPHSMIRRHHVFPRGPVWEGLVIDDYFVVSRELAGIDVEDSESVKKIDQAEQIYQEAGVFGSPEKNVREMCEEQNRSKSSVRRSSQMRRQDQQV